MKKTISAIKVVAAASAIVVAGAAISVESAPDPIAGIPARVGIAPDNPGQADRRINLPAQPALIGNSQPDNHGKRD